MARHAGNHSAQHRAAAPVRDAGRPTAASHQTPRKRAGAVMGIIVFAALFVGIAGFGVHLVFSTMPSTLGGNSEGQQGAVFDPAYVYISPYDWDCLANEDGRMAYYVDGANVARVGIDVSEHQDWIDWDAVAADGIDFAMIRVGYRGIDEGYLHVDDYFEYNFDAARDAGLDVGVYFFSQAINEDEAREEARLVLEMLDGAQLDYPVVFDAEYSTQGRSGRLTNGELTAIAQAFFDEIESAGYACMLYGNKSDLGHFNLDELSAWPIWHAEYASQPTGQYDFVMWQYTNSGYVDGIDDNVDMNVDLSAALSR